MTTEGLEKVEIATFIKGSTAVSVTDGDNVFKKLDEFFIKSKAVELDFRGIELLTTSFLNAAVGQLYSKYDSPFLQEHLKVINLSKEDIPLMRLVIQRAKSYFANKESFENSVRESSEGYE